MERATLLDNKAMNQSCLKKTFELSRKRVMMIYSFFVTGLLTFFLVYGTGSVKLYTMPATTPVYLNRSSLRTTPRLTTRAGQSINIFLNTPAPSKVVSRSCGNFVIFSNGFRDGRGLGNQIFNLAAGLLIAKLTQRRIAVNHTMVNNLMLEELFNCTYERFNDTCDIYYTGDKHNLVYNPELEMLEASKTTDFANKTIVISGFFQSWKYTLNEELLRSEYLRIKTTFKNSVINYFAKVQPRGWRDDTFTRVGVHARRGDVLTAHSVDFGYTTPSSGYFKKAMLYMLDLYKRVQFVVVSNDKTWVTTNLNGTLLAGVNKSSIAFDIVHSSYEDRNIDFSILASCHHNIMSTGTFGWWAAWLSRGTTVYYKEWPRKGSRLEGMFKREDFFPPSWVGMAD